MPAIITGGIMNTRILLAAIATTTAPTAPLLAGRAMAQVTVLASYAPTAKSTPDGGVALDGNGGVISVDRGATADGRSGAVLDFSPPSSPGNPWTVSVLYAFNGGADGATPTGDLIPDGAGGFYGTTLKGGSANAGTAYQITVSAYVPTWGQGWLQTWRFTTMENAR